MTAIERLVVGEVFEIEKTITDSDVLNFANASGDWGRLHTDTAFAKKKGFKGCIVHGVLLWAYISALVNKTLGDGAMVTASEGKFRAVDVGSTVILKIEVKKVDLKRRYVTFGCSCLVAGEPRPSSRGEALVCVLPDEPAEAEKE